MKTGIHPDGYRPVVFRDHGANFTFISRSTVKTTETIAIDGKNYPLCPLDISSASHPFFTGKQKFMDTAGRIERFQRKYAWTDGKAGTAPAEAPKAAPPAAAPADEKKGPKPKTLEASSLKQFAARSKHAPAPVALPKKPGSPSGAAGRGGDDEKAAEKGEKAEKPAGEPKGEKKPKAPKAEKPKTDKPAPGKAEGPAEQPKPAEEPKADATPAEAPKAE